ncbi:hypothetical protein [Arvimicrobium flavum]|uniref:hypothetical protein n=1 Tax=Arvimicrobium flavum TaxID=3393320 RepID=UPI00237A6A62|nr:hypothetical protein [Mesorhizobium shangrilense]
MTTTDLKERLNSFEDLEMYVRGVACMARILGDLLDENLVDYEGGTLREAGANVRIVLNSGQMDMLRFVWNDVIDRAINLERDFLQAAYGKEAA